MDSPLQQFVIRPLFSFELGGYHLVFTNASLFMLLGVSTILALFLVGTRKKSLAPGGLQAALEMIHGFIADMMKDTIDSPEQKAFQPLIFSLFLFILFGNLFGLLPYAYTVTSQLVVTFALASLVFVIVTVVGFYRHGWHFFSYFLPKGIPIFLAPLLIVIEFLSYLSRPVSLSIRLFANMMAGHTMLKVFALFTILLGTTFGLSTLVLNTCLIGFEFMVAFLQAYVFSVLSCLYLRDAIHLH